MGSSTALPFTCGYAIAGPLTLRGSSIPAGAERDYREVRRQVRALASSAGRRRGGVFPGFPGADHPGAARDSPPPSNKKWPPHDGRRSLIPAPRQAGTRHLSPNTCCNGGCLSEERSLPTRSSPYPAGGVRSCLKVPSCFARPRVTTRSAHARCRCRSASRAPSLRRVSPSMPSRYASTTPHRPSAARNRGPALRRTR